MESLWYVLLKIIIILLLFTIIILILFQSLQAHWLECNCIKRDMHLLYDEIDCGDIFIVRLSTWSGRVTMTPIAEFFHYVMVVKVPGDNINKYVFHVKNEAIKPLLHPELEFNNKIMGDYQYLELEEYLSYLANKGEYFVYLKAQNKHDFTLHSDTVSELEPWTGYFSRHCAYLNMDLMYKKGWTYQDIPSYTNKMYYNPNSVQQRLIDYDDYVFEGIFKPTHLEYIT